MSDKIDRIIVAAIVAGVIVCTIGLIAILRNVDDTACARGHYQTQMTQVWIGKSLVLIPQQQFICDEEAR